MFPSLRTEASCSGPYAGKRVSPMIVLEPPPSRGATWHPDRHVERNSLLFSRSEDADGELDGAAALQQIHQRVDVPPQLLGDDAGDRGFDAGPDEVSPPPRHQSTSVNIPIALTQAHAYLVSRDGHSLPAWRPALVGSCA